jgi:hypothetical protein
VGIVTGESGAPGHEAVEYGASYEKALHLISPVTRRIEEAQSTETKDGGLVNMFSWFKFDSCQIGWGSQK